MKLIVAGSKHFVFSTTNQKNKKKLPAGTYEVVEIPNPYSHPNAPWLVLTNDPGWGATKGFWEQWADPDYEELQVTLIEDGTGTGRASEEKIVA